MVVQEREMDPGEGLCERCSLWRRRGVPDAGGVRKVVMKR